MSSRSSIGQATQPSVNEVSTMPSGVGQNDHSSFMVTSYFSRQSKYTFRLHIELEDLPSWCRFFDSSLHLRLRWCAIVSPRAVLVLLALASVACVVFISFRIRSSWNALASHVQQGKEKKTKKKKKKKNRDSSAGCTTQQYLETSSGDILQILQKFPVVSVTPATFVSDDSDTLMQTLKTKRNRPTTRSTKTASNPEKTQRAAEDKKPADKQPKKGTTSGSDISGAKQQSCSSSTTATTSRQPTGKITHDNRYASLAQGQEIESSAPALPQAVASMPKDHRRTDTTAKGNKLTGAQISVQHSTVPGSAEWGKAKTSWKVGTAPNPRTESTTMSAVLPFDPVNSPLTHSCRPAATLNVCPRSIDTQRPAKANALPSNIDIVPSHTSAQPWMQALSSDVQFPPLIKALSRDGTDVRSPPRPHRTSSKP